MKISIVVERNLNPGQKANVAAIIMGQVTKNHPHLYNDQVCDTSGVYHAGIAVNIVVLDGGKEQLLSLVKNTDNFNVSCIVFSSTGQELSNNYAEYQRKISLVDTQSAGIVGVGLLGEESIIRTLTKKFSLTK